MNGGETRDHVMFFIPHVDIGIYTPQASLLAIAKCASIYGSRTLNQACLLTFGMPFSHLSTPVGFFFDSPKLLAVPRQMFPASRPQQHVQNMAPLHDRRRHLSQFSKSWPEQCDSPLI